MGTTPNFGFQLFLANWLDQHPGSGPVELANALLGNVDSSLSANRVTRVVQVSISQAQWLTSKASPVVILPALAVGLMARILFAVLEYVPVSAYYSLGDVANIYIGSAVNPISLSPLAPLPAAILTSASGPGNVIGQMPATGVVAGTRAAFETQPIVLTHDGTAELTSGDGTAVVTLAYQTVNL